MEPISAIVSAIVAGATAALKPAAEQAIKDAYQGLKSIVIKKWKDLDLGGIEATPDSKGQKIVLEEALTNTGAQDDPDLIAAAQVLLNTIQQHDPDVLLKVGVKLEDIDVKGNIRIKDVQGENQGVNIKDAKVGLDLEITGVNQRSQITPGNDSVNPQ